MSQPEIIKRALSDREAAVYIGMSVAFLRQDRLNGHREGRTPGPRWIKIGRSVRYLREDLDAWLEQLKKRAVPVGADNTHLDLTINSNALPEKKMAKRKSSKSLDSSNPRFLGKTKD
ncbi:helix-turn-helix transcriptional regulator [Nitrosococcus wardiae]|uniref:helix-turn-helix transcriptional regulator n=1 Tax=Nitrosococcus wardiae TaxID=1814290 RepID=UPI00197F1D57|nr:helix-turn-helix domain-containing protein [Nitrosococcus wardiae]